MTPYQFNEATRQHGLYLRGVGIGAAQDLKELAAAPVPIVPKAGWNDRSKKPTTLAHMGALIRAGLAKLEAGHYRATPEGTAWLGKIIERRLLPIPETNILQTRKPHP